MRIIVVDDYISAEETIRAATAGGGHAVTGVRTPEELRRVPGLAGFGLAFVDLDYRRLSTQTGLLALRLLDQAGVPAVIYAADDEDNRVLFLLAAFQFYAPAALVSKRASRAEIQLLVDTLAAGNRPASPAARRYEPPRLGPSLIDQLIVRASDLTIWQALAAHSDRLAIARSAQWSASKVDKFLAERFDVVQQVESGLLGRADLALVPGEVPPPWESRSRQHRLGPVRAFAAEHYHFFFDDEVAALVRARDASR
jgi:CheY-like chemotaxis protein